MVINLLVHGSTDSTAVSDRNGTEWKNHLTKCIARLWIYLKNESISFNAGKGNKSDFNIRNLEMKTLKLTCDKCYQIDLDAM